MAPPTHDFLLSLTESGSFSDFTLICDGQEFKLHQMIVCPQSPVINAALSGGFQEATSKVLIVKEFDISTVRYMVSFLYTGEYQIDLSNEARRNPIEEQYLQDFDQSDVGPENETVETLLAHSRINAIADYYDIENLAQLAISKFQGIIESGPDVEISPRIIQEVSTSNTNPDLQISVASFAAARIEDLCKLPAFRELEIEHSLAKKILHGCGLTKSVLKDTLQANQQQVAAYQDLLARESRKNELLEGMINRFMKLLEETDRCRNCLKDFGCRHGITGSGETVSYNLRCKGCLCRHT